uniref:SJCHGC08118 protein n=1 Tax=Schistosoma japonicum TaxID=6182 RepID=Q5BRJ2_SCHJA|nr:SJCHGC08118 protein [Schistosoma japonicum]
MIADDTLQFRSELHELVLLAFNSLPIMIFGHIGQLGADPLLLGSILLNGCATFEERLDKWICSVYSEVFFFGPSEVSVKLCQIIYSLMIKKSSFRP